jgi:NAD(P)-dependent dehydrogenase (short-subunit alcohol dehydrogenase family)
LDTNLYGVINGLNTFVPDFQKRGADAPPSAIVVTGSKQGITNPPGNAAYNASKAAVKALAEHLSYDLKETGTSVHLLVPGWTFTGLVSFIPSLIPSSQISQIFLWERQLTNSERQHPRPVRQQTLRRMESRAGQ